MTQLGLVISFPFHSLSSVGVLRLIPTVPIAWPGGLCFRRGCARNVELWKVRVVGVGSVGPVM